ncbi:MAG: hypothetical protein EHM58_09325 [Ignavibacteriae bacterium]|nr:MAG: hypothetical protein EHM58_09325 [Ignavibacteriota bacterium]
MEKTNLVEFDKLWDYNDPAATETKFRELLPHAEQSGDVNYHAQLLTQIARTQGLQRKFDDAHNTLDTVENMLTPDTPLARIRYLLERGRVFNSSKNTEKAIMFFKDAFNGCLIAHEDFYAVDAAHMMGIAEKGEESLKWNERAIELAELSTDAKTKGWLGSLLNNTGWTFHDMGNYDKAMDLFQKCLKWHEERNTGMGHRIAKWTVARTLRSLGNYKDALESQRALQKEIEDNNIEPDGYVYEEIGENLIALGQNDEAKQYFSKAYELISKDEWMAANEKERLERLKKLSE